MRLRSETPPPLTSEYFSDLIELPSTPRTMGRPWPTRTLYGVFLRGVIDASPQIVRVDSFPVLDDSDRGGMISQERLNYLSLSLVMPT
jgi:hypothetical protein